MNKKFIVLSLILIGLASVFTGCVSSTMIQSEPAGAKVFINGEYYGETPIIMADSKLALTSTYIRLEKEGYRTLETVIVRDEDIDFGAAIAGIFFYFPWLWVFEYKPVHNYLLEPGDGRDPDIEIDVEYFYQGDNPPQTTGNNKKDQPTSNKAQKLRDLKQLLDDGVITQDEYNIEKQKILDQDDW